MSKIYKFSNAEVIDILKETLAAMEVKEVNRFRIRAYQNAIEAIENLTSSVQDTWEKGRLTEINGIGSTLAQHINELYTTGKVKDFDDIKKDLPDGMFALIGLRGIGAKTGFKLAKAFELNDREKAVSGLKKVAKAKKIQDLPGFGEKSQADILKSIEDLKKTKNESPRMLFNFAEGVAETLIDYIKELDSVDDAVALGSLRRKESTVGDLDIAIATNDGKAAFEHFLKHDEIAEVLVNGDKKIAVELKNGVQVDVRYAESKAFGAMLQYFTGSKMHNVLLRSYALEQNKSLTEYGIKHKGENVEFATEQEFYKYLGLNYIEPELRIGDKEIELSKANKLPNLVKLNDIKGDLHTHTVYSDGVNSLKEMVEAAKEFNYEYFGISDHAPSVQTRGSYEVLGIIENRINEIEQLNSSQDGIRVLYGYEINILADGSIAMPDNIIQKLDYAIASIHTSLNQPKDQITKRLINAIENPYIKIIGHPSGRLLNERAPYDVDWDKVLDAAAANDTILEINSQPDRLDLADDLVRLASEKGVKFIVNTDAHHMDQLHNMRFGINVARRGYLEAEQVVNTYSLEKFLKVIN